MIKKKIYYIIVFLLLACNENNDSKNRTIINYKLSEQRHFEHTFGTAIRMNVQNNIISLSNAPSFGIYQYNLYGNLIRKLTEPGSAPWESHAIWHFSFTKDGKKYWVHDYDKQSIKCYDYAKDSMLFYIKEITQGNVHPIDDDNFIIPHTDIVNNKFLFSIYNIPKKEYIKHFSLTDSLKIKSNIVNQKDLCLWLLSGNFADNYKNNLLYYIYDIGRFFIFNKKEKTMKIYKDVRNLPIPIAYVKNQGIHFTEKSIAAISGCIDAKYVYILSVKYNSEKLTTDNTYLIDIYQINNGKYLKSIEVPKYDGNAIPKQISLSQNKLIILYDSQVIVSYNFTNKIVENL